ncbi:PREDICTED: uncharacterized protein LOC107190619 [Dufourea novaeangliae]|uniref:uncharacterized protein LOC107190619 n=1 Tax=Dufourea novaeangliae TaxID=178035 RepID=UPI00076793AD|nr:PREDICTED: uncharacterized protein LOC107190619 [Dufourea novaeangliae]
MGRKKSGRKNWWLPKGNSGEIARTYRGSGERKMEEADEKEGFRPDREEKISIGVGLRLNYPLVGECLPEDLEISSTGSDDEEFSIEMTVKPRFMFVASLCAVCLERSEFKVLCECCRMLSYCSIAHRKQGLPEHRDLCESLKEIRSSIASTMSAESNERLNAEQYRVYRLELLTILEAKSGRPLNLWEKEIVLYPRVCRICRCFSESLICCAVCAMESFCQNHREEHEKWCKEFQVLQRCLFLQNKHGCVYPKIPNKPQRSSVALSDTSFDELIMHRIYENSSYYREMDCFTYSTLSHLCTIPLTTLYSIEISCPEWQKKTELVVHVLGAEFQFEGVNLHVWEKMFLHFLPNLKRLCLVLVGPELRLPNGVPPNLLSKVKLCSECKAASRAVVVVFRPETLYHELVREKLEHDVKPDLICAFNPGLYRKTGFAGKDTWPETIKEFCKTKTPVVITAYTADEMFWEIARIKSVDKIEVMLESQQNPFASIKPDRNFVSDDTSPLIYKNYYIGIIKGESTLP